MKTRKKKWLLDFQRISSIYANRMTLNTRKSCDWPSTSSSRTSNFETRWIAMSPMPFSALLLSFATLFSTSRASFWLWSPWCWSYSASHCLTWSTQASFRLRWTQHWINWRFSLFWASLQMTSSCSVTLGANQLTFHSLRTICIEGWLTVSDVHLMRFWWLQVQQP